MPGTSVSLALYPAAIIIPSNHMKLHVSGSQDSCVPLAWGRSFSLWNELLLSATVASHL